MRHLHSYIVALGLVVVSALSISDARATSAFPALPDTAEAVAEEIHIEETGPDVRVVLDEVAPPPIGAPRALAIPAIDVEAPVVAMGLEPDGKMDVPDNYTEIGWYAPGAKPGEVGAAVMGAHVDNGSWKDGVFKHLKNMEVGDDIYVTDEHGASLHFRVVETKVYGYKERDTSSVFLAPDKKALRLITCHGTWLPAENTYDSRFIVFAELME